MSIDTLTILKNQKQKRFEKLVKTDPNLTNIRQITEMVVTELISQKTLELNQLKQELIKEFTETIDNIASSVKDGQPGDKGDKGDKGEPGEIGPQGLPGKDGVDGHDGMNGKDGKPGKDGKAGKAGKDGKPGKDGSPDKPKQIIEKLNTLKNVLEPDVIKGFWDVINRLQTNIKNKQSGGGMGNVQHESKSVSAGTTSVATNYGIAGGGFAIWAYYQGQLIMRGVHYTVAGKTLTLTFTPDNNTTIDIIYIRG